MKDITINGKHVGKIESGTFTRVVRSLGKNKEIIFTQASVNKALQEGARQIVVHEMKTGLLYMASMQTLTRLGFKYSDQDGTMYIGLNEECMVIVRKNNFLGN